MSTMATKAAYSDALIASRAGKQMTRDFNRITLPENTSIIVLGLIVAEGTEDATLATIDNLGAVTGSLEIGRKRTPNWTPAGQEWEARVEFIGGHRVIS